MAIFSVADKVEKDVALEFLPDFDGEFCREEAAFRIFCIDVENREAKRFGDIGGVAGRAPFFGQCRVSDLVVQDEVDRPADRIIGKLMNCIDS